MAQITQQQILALSEPVEQIYSNVVDALLVNLAKHLKGGGTLTTEQWEMQKLSEMGQLTQESIEIIANLTGLAPEELTGRGAGLTDDAFRKKKDVIRRALTLHRPDPADPVGVLSAVGGLDLAAMTGAFLGLAAAHVPAVADGLISVVAALCAVRLCPRVRDVLFLSHASYEIGYRLAARELGLEPCLLLGMRLGEGSGCPVMFQILRAACAVMDGMATFPEAAIEDDYLAPIRAQDSFTVTP